MKTNPLVLVTGATGYVGGRLVPRLLQEGYRVRVLVRDTRRLQDRAWLGQVEVFEGDVLKPETLIPAMQGVQSAYYLIHSMMSSPDFHQRDLEAARSFSKLAEESGVARIIYLGGLGDPDTQLSAHLRSRQQTGDALRQSGVPVTEFRAAVIVGSGSISFEMVRYLTERVPVMICPRWVFTRTQPISIQSVLDYLVAALDVPESADKIIEIGGAEVLNYGEMMLGYASVRDLRRVMIPVPVLTPRLSSYWVHWVTPISAQIARPLIEGLRNEVVVRNDLARRLFPDIEPLDYRSAVRMALDNLEVSGIETSWSDALSSSQGNMPPVMLKNHEGMIIERRQQQIDSSAEDVFRTVTGIGGERGWPYMNWVWRLRGMFDRLVGGVGFRRGRRHPDEVRVGDALDFFRVEAVEPGRLLRLRVEMKLPGRAWLQFEVQPKDDQALLVQTTFFAPKGFIGFMYWYLSYPIHALVFSGMLRALAFCSQSIVSQGAV